MNEPRCSGSKGTFWNLASDEKSPADAGLSRCAEEDSNLHPVIPD